MAVFKTNLFSVPKIVNIYKVCLNQQLLSNRYAIGNSASRRYISSSTQNPANIKDRENWVTVTDDGSTIVCWHPETEFPYEHSKPIPRELPELRESDSVLKVQYRLDHKKRYQPDGPTDKELIEMTYSSKYVTRFNRDKKRTRYELINLDELIPPRNREGGL